MRTTNSLSIRVPGTVGNFAGAMGCGALALDASMNVKVTLRLDGKVALRYFGEDGERVPRDHTNLVVRAMQSLLERHCRPFSGADFEIYSAVPVAAGFGSSAAATLAGLIAADRLFRLELDEKAMFEHAALCDSSAENLRAAWLGGFVACNQAQGSAVYQHTQVPDNFVVTTVIPAVRGKGIRAVEDALNIQVAGSPSVFLCGSGPAIGILAAGDSTPAVRAVREAFAQHGIPTTTVEYRPANLGARHWLDLQVPTAELTHSVSKPNLIPV